jgi:hypothetical protein
MSNAHRTPKSTAHVNRNTITKVLRDAKLGPDDESCSADSEENPLHDKLETCTVEELAALKQNSMKFDETKYPEHKIDVVASQLSSMNRREPMRFTAPLPTLTPLQILQKFDTFFTTTPDPRNRDPVLLNIDPQSAFYTRLRQWSQYEVIGDIFDPVHLALFDHANKERCVVECPKTLVSLVQLQNALIHSHHQTTEFKTDQLIEQLEHMLYSKLLDIYVNRRTAIFMFEWNQSSPYELVVCFGIVAAAGGGSDTKLEDDSADELVTLTRDDLLNDSALLLEDTIMTKREKAVAVHNHIKKGKKHKKIDLNQRRAFVRASRLSYLYYGFLGRD